MLINTFINKSSNKCLHGTSKTNNIKSFHNNKFKTIGNHSFKTNEILSKIKNNGWLPKNSKNSNKKKYNFVHHQILNHVILTETQHFNQILTK